MTRFWRHLRVLKFLLLGSLLLSAAGCQSLNQVTGPASRSPGVATVGAIGGAAAGALIVAGMTRNPSLLLTALGAAGGAAAGGVGLPLLVDAVSPPGVPDGAVYESGGYKYMVVRGSPQVIGTATGMLPQQSTSVYGQAPQTVYVQPGYAVPAPAYGLATDNPTRAGQACQPTPRFPARAVTSSGTPWVGCSRLLAAGEQAIPLRFR